MHQNTKETIISLALTAFIGILIGTYLAGAYSLGIFSPLILYSFGAAIGGVIGWGIAFIVKLSKLFRAIIAYATGLLLCSYVTYYATIDELIENAYKYAKANNPYLTDDRWRSIYTSLTQEHSAIATHKAVEITAIVLGWILLYLLIKLFVRKYITRAPGRTCEQDPSNDAILTSPPYELVIISCPNCTQKLRVPGGHQLRINCRSCGMEFEMKT